MRTVFRDHQPAIQQLQERAGAAFVRFIEKRVKSTYSDRVMPLEGGYAGLFSLVSDKKRFSRVDFFLAIVGI